MNGQRFQKGQKVYVWSIGMTAIVVAVVGNQYVIYRSDGKFDYVMSNGLKSIQKEGENIGE